MLQVFDIRAPLPRPGLSPVCVCVRACAHTWRVGALCLLVGGTVSVQVPASHVSSHPAGGCALASQAGGLHLAPEARALGLPLPQGFRRC